MVKKYIQPSVHTAKGHLRQERKGLHSKKLDMEQLENLEKDTISSSVKTQNVIYALISHTDKAFMDLTGRFSHWSSHGNKYILITYSFDANLIIGEPVQNRQASTLTAAWRKLRQTFKNTELAPNT